MHEKRFSSQLEELYKTAIRFFAEINTTPKLSPGAESALYAVGLASFAAIAHNAEEPIAKNISGAYALMYGAYAAGYYASYWSSDTTNQQLKNLITTTETTLGRMGRELSLGTFLLSGGPSNPTLKTVTYPCTIGTYMAISARAGLKQSQADKAATLVHNAHNAGTIQGLEKDGPTASRC